VFRFYKRTRAFRFAPPDNGGAFSCGAALNGQSFDDVRSEQNS
jgi:hypothetical protein